jgi:hypothetical protein
MWVTYRFTFSCRREPEEEIFAKVMASITWESMTDANSG